MVKRNFKIMSRKNIKIFYSKTLIMIVFRRRKNIHMKICTKNSYMHKKNMSWKYTSVLREFLLLTFPSYVRRNKRNVT